MQTTPVRLGVVAMCVERLFFLGGPYYTTIRARCKGGASQLVRTCSIIAEVLLEKRGTRAVAWTSMCYHAL